MLKDSRIIPYIPVKDVPRARKFYEGTIGLKVKEEYDGGVFYEGGNGSVVFLYKTDNAGTNKASTLFWDVADVEKEVRELKERGVKFEEYDMPGVKMVDSIVNAGGAKAAWFKDPDGNILAIAQRLK